MWVARVTPAKFMCMSKLPAQIGLCGGPECVDTSQAHPLGKIDQMRSTGPALVKCGHLRDRQGGDLEW